MDNETSEIGIIALISSVHDGVTMVMGSAADVSGIALAFHIDNLVLRIIIITIAVHLTFGLVLTACKRVKRFHKRSAPVHHTIVGFVPPKR